MVKTEIQIRFSDCDMMNHVNNAIYLQYFELARINFFNSQVKKWNWKKQGIILAKNTINYLKPVFLNDKIEIEVDCIHIGNSSFTLSYNLINFDQDVKIKKTYGESVLVCYDFVKDESTSIPNELLAVLKNNLIQK